MNNCAVGGIRVVPNKKIVLANDHTGEPKFITVAGASAGGLNSIIGLTAQLTPVMDLSVFVVLHLSKTRSPTSCSSAFKRRQRSGVRLPKTKRPSKPGIFTWRRPTGTLFCKEE